MAFCQGGYAIIIIPLIVTLGSIDPRDSYAHNPQIHFAKYPDVVSVTQLGQMLHISERLAYRLIRENQIACLKIGRTYKIPKINVIKYLGIIDQSPTIRA